MLAQLSSLALIALLGAMSPGPDFAVVTKNTLLHSRKAGFITAFGLGGAILVHMTYCVLGLALVIASSPWLFNLIKYAGASYLIYIGLSSWFAKQPKALFSGLGQVKKRELSNVAAFRQGFLCNLLNPKATLFFLSLFTVIIKPETPMSESGVYALEIFVITIAWFCTLAAILSHPRIKRVLERAEKYISKILGLFLVMFGVVLVFV